MELIRGPIKRAQKVCVYGPEGIGKSTLAAKFPDPVFIDTEGSTVHLDVARLPFPTSWAMLMGQVDHVRKNPDICKTLVIDTADWAEALCKTAVCARSGKDGIEDFGYGKGYVYLAEEFGKLLNALNDVIERGVHVVFTAHAQMRKFEQPDEAGSYDRWELKLEKKTAPLIKEWADIVLFANYKTFVVNVDDKGGTKGRNIAQGGKRVMYTTHHPAWDAKNRHNLPEELPLDYDAIAHCFLVGSGMTQPAKPQAKPQPMPHAPTPNTRATVSYWHHPESSSVFTVGPGEELPSDGLSVEIDAAEFERLLSEYNKPEPQPEPAATEPAPFVDDLEAHGVPKALADLMRSNGVTLDEVQKVVSDRGYFPADTPFRNYPSDFVEGVLIGAWDQVLAAIQESRDYVPF